MRNCLRLLAPLLGASLLAAAPPDSLDLGQLQTLAWPAANGLQAARAAESAGALAAREAAARRAPRLDLDARAGWVSEVQELSLPAGSVRFGDGRSADLALVGAWTLYAGGRLEAGQDAARAEARARSHERRADSLALAAELRESFIASLGADAALEAARTSRVRLERHLLDLQGRWKAGAIGEELLLEAGARLERARREEALGEVARDAARLELGRLAGLPGKAPVARGDLEIPLLGGEVEAPPRLDAQLALEARLAGADARIHEAAGAKAPQLDLQAGWHLARPGVDPVANDWMDYASVGLALRWPLWDSHANRLREERVRAERHRVRAGLAESESRLQSARAQARAALDGARRAWQAAVAARDLELRRLDLVEGRWKQGLAVERDWLDAHDDLRLSRIDERLALARLRQAESRLLSASGR